MLAKEYKELQPLEDIVDECCTDFFQSNETASLRKAIQELSAKLPQYSRTSSTQATARVGALLECRDIADFNPGGSFGPGNLFQDDWFILMRDLGIGKDYTESAYMNGYKTYNIRLPE